MRRKILKISAFLFAGLIIFVLLVVLIGDRFSPLIRNIKIPFMRQSTKVSDNGFTQGVDLLDKIDVHKLAEIDWAATFNRALQDKRSLQSTSIPRGKNAHISPKTTVSSTTTPKYISNSKSQAFLKYLAESDLHLDNSVNPFQQAINYRDSNQPEKISQLIQNIDNDIARLEKVIPPEEVIGYHLVRLRLLREIRAVMAEIQVSSKGKPLEEIVSKDELNYLEKLSLILKKYLTYFFYPQVRA